MNFSQSPIGLCFNVPRLSKTGWSPAETDQSYMSSWTPLRLLRFGNHSQSQEFCFGHLRSCVQCIVPRGVLISSNSTFLLQHFGFGRFFPLTNHNDSLMNFSQSPIGLPFPPMASMRIKMSYRKPQRLLHFGMRSLKLRSKECQKICQKECQKKRQERMSENMPERMLEDTSERMPEDMSERMSEEMSRKNVRKYARKNVRRYLRKNVRRYLRKNVRRYVRKNVRKYARKNVRRYLRKNVRRYLRKNVRRYVRKNVRRNVKKECQKICQKEC